MAAEVKSFQRRQEAEARRSKNDNAVPIIARRRVNTDRTADPESRGEDFEKHSKEEGDRAEDKNDYTKKGPSDLQPNLKGPKWVKDAHWEKVDTSHWEIGRQPHQPGGYTCLLCRRGGKCTGQQEMQEHLEKKKTPRILQGERRRVFIQPVQGMRGEH